MHKVVLITGGSSGIGKAVGELLLQKGCTVYGTSRNPDRISNSLFPLLMLDVRNTVSIQKTVAEIIEKSGRVDVVINNAGVGITGPVEETPIEEIKNNFIIVIASDSLSRWIIQALSIIDYASCSKLFKTNFLQSLNTGKYEERKVAIHLNSTYSSTDELLKYLQKSAESIEFFKHNLKELIESEQIDLDDYLLIFIEGNVSK